MNVISVKNEILNSSVSVSDIAGVYGLVMESRGGAKGKPDESSLRVALLSVGATCYLVFERPVKFISFRYFETTCFS